MSKRILVVLSEWGFWGEELVGPLEAFDEQGYAVDFVTPTGKRPVAHRRQHGSRLRRPAARALGDLAGDGGEGEGDRRRSPRLDNPLNLSELMPERPYHSEDDFLRKQEAYYKERDEKASGARRHATTRC